METKSILTCPHCGHIEDFEMPTDYCQYTLLCPNCNQMIYSKEGDCCVFCSYGTNPCPSMQKN